MTLSLKTFDEAAKAVSTNPPPMEQQVAPDALAAKFAAMSAAHFSDAPVPKPLEAVLKEDAPAKVQGMDYDPTWV